MAQTTKQKTTGPTAPGAQRTTLLQRIKRITDQVRTLAVTNAEQSKAASLVLRDAALLRRDIEKEYKALREPLVIKQRQIIAEEKELTAALVAAEKKIADTIRTFTAREAQERAAKEAAERKRREDEARAEAQLRADQLRAAAAAAESKTVARRLEAQAAVVENATPIIDPVETEEAPEVLADGVHTRKNYRAQVDNAQALLLQIAAGIMLEQFGGKTDKTITAFLSVFKPNKQATANLIAPAQPKLNELAKAFPNDLALEGVRVVEDEGFVARR